MKVSDLMTRDVITIDGRQTLVEAARLMWDYDCGILPVVSANGEIRGMITDRDICRALTKGRPATRIPVREIASFKVYVTTPDADIETALQTMKAHRVRRLPVVDAGGHLQGLLSIDDAILHAGGFNGVRELAVIDALKGICVRPTLQVA